MTTARILVQTHFIDRRQQKLRDGYDINHVLESTQKIPDLDNVEIDLSENYLSVNVVSAIAIWLRSGQAPERTVIHLQANEVDDEGAKILADAVNAPKAPKHIILNLGSNKITDKGAEYWAQALGKGSSALTLTLTANYITEKGAAKLEAAKERSYRTVALDLAGNKLNVVKRNEGKTYSESAENFRHRVAYRH